LAAHAVSISRQRQRRERRKFGFMGGVLLGGLHLIDRFLMVDRFGQAWPAWAATPAGAVGGAIGLFGVQGPR
jgi:hypothetical protein